MALKTTSGAAFAKTLRSLETGGLTYSDVLAEIKILLATGASPTELREILRGRELIEPLSEHARVEMFGLLNDAIAHEKNQPPVAPEAQNPQSEPTPDQPRASAPTSISGPTLVATSGRSTAAGQGTAPPAATPVAGARGPQLVSNQNLPSKAEAAAVARATALAADLAAARTALESERSKNREAATALADRVSAMEAARVGTEERLREARRWQTEAHALRDSVAARDAQLAALTQEHASQVQALEARAKGGTQGETDLLAARDAQIAALTQEQAKLVQALEARAQSCKQLEADLRVARAGESDLAVDLGAARTALEFEQSKTQERHKAWADRIASTETALALAKEALRESERRQADAHALRESLAGRDAQLAALTRDHATMVAALEGRSKNGTQLEAELQTARARALALAADLAAARTELESARRKAPDSNEASNKIESAEAARSRSEEALRESEKHKAALERLRDTLMARDAEFAALQQEHAKIVTALEARKQSGTQAESDLLSARARVSAISSELKASQEAAVSLNAQLSRGESLLAAARTELEAVKGHSKADLELLRTRDRERREPPQHTAPLPPRPSAQAVEADSLNAARIALAAAKKEKSEEEMLAAAARGKAWKPGAAARAIGFGAAVIMLAAAAWLYAHRTSAPTGADAPVSSAAPQTPGMLIHDCPTCPAMTVLPAGRFKQGSSRANADTPSIETPQRWVGIHSPFAMSTNSITVDEFGQFIAATGRDMQGCDTYDGTWKHQADKNWKDPGFVQTGNHPVTCVSWQDADAYATWLSTKTGHKYRLPSASEWEYAARTGGEAVQPWNSNGAGTDACANANVADQSAARRYPGWQVFACDDGYVYTSPVGSFKTNSFGVNDMLGNVFQWTEDCWHADYSGAPIDGSARIDGNCAVRELRGGSWFTSPAYVRANYRNHFAVEYRTSTVGIRLVRELAQ